MQPIHAFVSLISTDARAAQSWFCSHSEGIPLSRQTQFYPCLWQFQARQVSVHASPQWPASPSRHSAASRSVR